MSDRRVVHPHMGITPRQREVLRLTCQGLRAHQIADRLGVSARTVEHHKYKLMEQLDVRTTAHLAFLAGKHGLVEDDVPRIEDDPGRSELIASSTF